MSIRLNNPDIMGEMADVADTVEPRMNRSFDMEDIRMDKLEQEVEEIQDRTRDDHNWIVQLQEEVGDIRNRNNFLLGHVETLEVQVRDLMAFRTVLQHGPVSRRVFREDSIAPISGTRLPRITYLRECLWTHSERFWSLANVPVCHAIPMFRDAFPTFAMRHPVSLLFPSMSRATATPPPDVSKASLDFPPTSTQFHRLPIIPLPLSVVIFPRSLRTSSDSSRISSWIQSFVWFSILGSFSW